MDGAWQNVDTTPPAWAGVEDARASGWEPLHDLAARAWFLFSRWRFSEEAPGTVRTLGWLLIPLAAFLVGRLRGIRRQRRAAPAAPSAKVAAAVPLARPGEDSELYLIERRLGEQGLARAPGEPLARWLERLDPLGLSPTERAELRRAAESWLERHGRSPLGPGPADTRGTAATR